MVSDLGKIMLLVSRILILTFSLGHYGSLVAQVKTPTAGSTAEWIKIVGQPPFVMPADQEKEIALPLLVSLDPIVEAKDVTVELLSVRYDKLVDERITQIFSVDPSIERGSGRGLSILVKVASATMLRPGEYQLTIAAKPPKGGPALPLVVNLERPGVQLTPLGKVSLDLIYGFSIWGSPVPNSYPKQLRLTQTPESRFSQISKITSFSGSFKNSHGMTAGRLEISAATPVAPGEPLLLTVTPKGFPAGVSTGALDIRGPDIKVSQSVEIEIHTRYSTVWVIVLIIAGLALGYIVRVALQERIELARARSDSISVAETLERRLSRTPDEIFTQKIKTALQDLREVLTGRDPKKIEEKTKTSNTALEEATKDLQARLNTTQDRIKNLRAIVDAHEDLPPEMAGLFRSASNACTQFSAYVAALDVTRAVRGLDATEKELLRNLQVYIARWKTSLPVRLKELERLQFVLQEDTTDELVKALTVIRANIDSTVSPGDLAQLPIVLAKIREVQVNVAARLEWLSNAILGYFQEFELLFTVRNGARDEHMTVLGTQVSELRNQLLAASQSIDPTKSMCEEETRQIVLSTFEKLLDGLLTKYRDNLKESELNAFQSARMQQRYVGALRALPASATQLNSDTELLGDLETGRIKFEHPESRTPDATPRESAPHLPIESIVTLKGRTFRELAAAEGAQTAIAAVLITGLGYFLFAEKFVGTLTDIATIFLWGFTLDISVSKLLEIAAPITAKARV